MNAIPDTNKDKNLIILIHPGHIADEEPYMPYESMWNALIFTGNIIK